MKDKVLIRISVPMADMAYDFRVPLDLPLGTVSEMITGMLRNATEEQIPLSNVPLLWCAKTGIMPDRRKTIRELGLTDSDMLLLI